MCIYVKKEAVLKKAEEDIVCYKQLDLSPYKFFGPIYTTPFTNTLIYFMRKGKVFRAKGKINRYSSKFKNEDCIDKGLIHCYIYKGKHYTGIPLFKCIIPKGTKYIKDCNGREIAAKKIKFIERIY